MTVQRQKWLSAYLFLFFVCLESPLLIIVLTSFSSDETVSFPPAGLSLRWYADLWHQLWNQGGVKPGLAMSLWTSVWLSVLSAAGATVAGVAAALGLRFFSSRSAGILKQYLLFPILFPQVVIGIGLLLWFSALGGMPVWTKLLLGHFILTMPYVVVTTSASLEMLDPALEEAAMNLGANFVRTLGHVTLPMIRAGILSGALFAWLTSFSNFTISFFLYSGETRPAPVWIFEVLQFVIDPSLAALSTVLLLTTLVVLFSANRILGIGRLVGLRR